MHGLFEYDAPAELLLPIRAALRWVKEPGSDKSVLAAGRVRRVRAEGRTLHVVLLLPPGPLVQVVVDEAQAEICDQLRGEWNVRVRALPQASRSALRVARGGD